MRRYGIPYRSIGVRAGRRPYLHRGARRPDGTPGLRRRRNGSWQFAGTAAADPHLSHSADTVPTSGTPVSDGNRHSPSNLDNGAS